MNLSLNTRSPHHCPIIVIPDRFRQTWRIFRALWRPFKLLPPANATETFSKSEKAVVSGHSPSPWRPLTPTQKDKQSLTLYLLSKKASKASIAAIASKIANNSRVSAPPLSLNALNDRLEGWSKLSHFLRLHAMFVGQGFPSPDFMIVYSLSPSTYHRTPLELHGFPPWQLSLTEIQ